MRIPRIASLAAACLALSACAGTGATSDAPSSSVSVAASSSAPSSAPASPSGATDESTSPNGTASAATSAEALAACRTTAGKLDREQKIGQLFMVAVLGQSLDPDLRQTMTERHIGSAFYLGNNTPKGVDATAVVSAQVLNAAGDIPVLIAVDQEGGVVQRLTGPGFDEIPSAERQAELAPTQLAQSWQRWGKQLRTAGVRMNLAPVVDVVPTDKAAGNEPIAKLRRGYGSDDDTVAQLASAAVEGMHRAKVASSAKHFPGIGRVTTNTDFGSAHDDVTTADDVAAFTRVMQAGVDSVMVGTVVYDKIDPDNHAAFSSTIVTDLLRGKLGWQGVVISDDLGAAQAVADVTPPERAVRFVAAGGDIVITADPSNLGSMVDGVAARAEADPDFAAQLDEHVARVLALKQSVGLVTCGS